LGGHAHRGGQAHLQTHDDFQSLHDFTILFAKSLELRVESVE
jgi:hypothetical protein